MSSPRVPFAERAVFFPFAACDIHPEYRLYSLRGHYKGVVTRVEQQASKLIIFFEGLNGKEYWNTYDDHTVVNANFPAKLESVIIVQFGTEKTPKYRLDVTLDGVRESTVSRSWAAVNARAQMVSEQYGFVEYLFCDREGETVPVRRDVRGLWRVEVAELARRVAPRFMEELARL